MKPDWQDAPSWAKFLAQDPDGEWCWYEFKPYWSYKDRWGSDEGRFYRESERARQAQIDQFKETLEGRP